MLTSIPRFARVMEANVGPRFAEYSTYTRPGVSLYVAQAAVAFEQPQVLLGDGLMVQAKIYQPIGDVTVSAMIDTTIPTYKRRPVRGSQTIARAVILGTPLHQDFGYSL